MFIDKDKLAQINRTLATISLSFDSISKENYFDKTIKSIIRLIIPYKRAKAFEEFVEALKGTKDFSQETIQNIVNRLKEIFPDEVKQLDISKYENWIKENESRWKARVELVELDRIFYGLAKETK